jgi:hypothetical protein
LIITKPAMCEHSDTIRLYPPPPLCPTGTLSLFKRENSRITFFRFATSHVCTRVRILYEYIADFLPNLTRGFSDFLLRRFSSEGSLATYSYVDLHTIRRVLLSCPPVHFQIFDQFQMSKKNTLHIMVKKPSHGKQRSLNHMFKIGLRVGWFTENH